ncbi:hypothetical protein IRJ41_002028 [Triplophysa rosa]|uniref:Uncharacterized protein n=1 Tax=Triplophysa rosa TaxID=992332 RepID=A0A9W7WKF4_TRIRA|nr:hypothetical protein IRJ41_002028 [Triplophysa rosa]
MDLSQLDAHTSSHPNTSLLQIRLHEYFSRSEKPVACQAFSLSLSLRVHLLTWEYRHGTLQRGLIISRLEAEVTALKTALH